MKREEIKQQCEKAYKEISIANDTLKELRAICKHEETFEGMYSWRVGSTTPATICHDCGHVINNS